MKWSREQIKKAQRLVGISAEFAEVCPDGIEVRDSPVAGRGVFAVKPIKANTIVGPYGGEVYSMEEFEKDVKAGLHFKNDYLFEVYVWKKVGNKYQKVPIIVDGADCRISFYGRFFNTNFPSKVNCRAVAHSPKGRTIIEIITTKPVKADEELFFEYSRKFCKKILGKYYHQG